MVKPWGLRCAGQFAVQSVRFCLQTILGQIVKLRVAHNKRSDGGGDLGSGQGCELVERHVGI